MTNAFAPARLAAIRGVNAAFASFIVLALAASCWLPDLSNSLLLDETLTFWVIRDGLAETIDRSLHFQPQPAYYFLMWFWTQIAGTSEIALRLPSVLSTLAACVMVAKLGARLTRDRETGWLTAVVFASTWNVYRESVDARSYMLGLAVLLALALCLIRWIEDGRPRDAVFVGLLAALLPLLHVFFALCYPGFALYLALRWRESRCTLRQLGVIGLFLGLGLLLFLPVGAMLAAQGGSYSFVAPPRWRSLFEVFVWGAPIAGLLAGTIVASLLAFETQSAPQIESTAEAEDGPEATRATLLGSSVLIAAWVLVPLLGLFAVSVTTGMSVFLGRYLIPAVPAVCVLYAIALRRIPVGRARVVAAVVVALAAFFVHERPYDDFRGAADAVNAFVARDSDTPVLVASGLIEGEDEKWLRDPILAAYLNAPTEYYPIEGRLVTLPRRLQDHSMAKASVEPILGKMDRFAALEWYGNGARTLRWLSQRAERAGYRIERRSFGAVRVAFFSRGRD